jgi:peroxiredoxin
VVDLHSDPRFNDLDVELLSISPDTPEDWADAVAEQGVQSPVLSDPGNVVAQKYDVMQWAMPSGEPGHTFVLVGKDGRILWIRDYGATENGGLMYVVPKNLLEELEPALRSGD